MGNKIQELFDAQVVIIATFDNAGAAENFQCMFENGERFYPESRPLDKLKKHLIETRQKILINNPEEAFGWFGKEVLPGTKYMLSGIFVPLVTFAGTSSDILKYPVAFLFFPFGCFLSMSSNP